MEKLETQLARSRAAQIVGDVLAGLDGHANEPLIVLLVAEELALLGIQGAAFAGGKEKALRQALSFVADVELRILKWLDASSSVLQLPGRARRRRRRALAEAGRDRGDGVKRQTDIWRDPRLLAEQIARELLTDGAGEEAQRLVLTVDTPAKRELGGWGREPLIDKIEYLLRPAFNHKA